MLTMMILVGALAQQSATPSPSPAFVREVRAELDERLFDYPSARFREVQSTNMVMCGFINGKNRLGAYTGWRRFAAFKSADPAQVWIEEPDRDNIMVDTFCQSVAAQPSVEISARLRGE